MTLPTRFSAHLSSLPETGMGYQVVRVLLKNGQTLAPLTVLNSSLLVLDRAVSIRPTDIEKIELV